MIKTFQLLITIIICICPLLVNSQNNYVLVGNPDSPTAEKYSLSGFIKSGESKESLAGATVQVRGTKFNAVTNRYGKYELKIPGGQYILEVNFIGHDPKLYYIDLQGNGSFHMSLSESVLSLQEVVIENSSYERRFSEMLSGIEKLTIDDIKDLPTFLGEVDVIKSLQTLPGVSTAGEGASGFNVRGGRADQNLILQDGGILFNSQHVLGFFSSFNPDAVNGFTLYKGNVPAYYGGRSSSVLDVQLRDGNSDKIQGRGGIGLVASRLTIDGPLISDKTTFLLSGRSSYSDWILSRVKNIDISQSNASFYDFNAKLSHRFNNNNKLDLSVYGSNDNFRFSDQFGFAWSNLLLNATYNRVFSDKLLMTTSVIKGEYSSQLEDPSGIDAARVNNGIDYYQFKNLFLYELNKNHTLNFGAEAVFYSMKPESSERLGDESGITPETVNKENGRELSLFVNDEIKFSPKWSASLGLRYSFFQNVGDYTVFQYAEDGEREINNIIDTIQYNKGDVIKSYGGLEPRASFRYEQSQFNSFKFGYSRMRQYIHTLSNTTAGTPTDILQLSNTYVEPAITDNYSVGFFRNTKNGKSELSIEAYYKNIRNLLEYKDFVELLLNNHLETDLLSAQGRSYGVEFLYKKTKGIFTGWLSYTYSRTEVKVDGDSRETTINNGEWFPANFDTPHNLSIISVIKIKDESSFSWNVSYNRGRPITAVVSSYNLGETVVPNFSERNAFRIPDYFRIDLSLTVTNEVLRRVKKEPKKEGYRSSLTFSVYNLLGRRNAFSVFFRKPDDFGLIPLPHKLSVLGTAFPAITYNFKF